MKSSILTWMLCVALMFSASAAFADSLTFRKTHDYKCRVMCGEFRNGKVEVGNIYRNGKFVGTYKIYESKDGEKKKTDLSIREGN